MSNRRPDLPQPAGKQPALRPISTPSTPAVRRGRPSRISKSTPRKKVAPASSAANRIITRSQSKIFRWLFDLPGEIRNHIYSSAYVINSPDLSNFTIPAALSACRKVREEGLPVFFATNIFHVTLRCNWCVFASHFHGPLHVRYNDTGVVELSPFLLDGWLGLPEEAIRFQHVDFHINCVCCISPTEIGTLSIRVLDRKQFVESKLRKPEQMGIGTTTSWKVMTEAVESVIKRSGERSIFNGFMVEDIARVASCFRHRTRN